MPMPPIFLINLDRSHERLALMQAQANVLGLAFERIPAIDGTRQLPGWMVSQFLDDRGLVRGGLSEGEVGCYASHLLVMSTIVERRLEAAIVLEDDAILDADFEQAACAAVRAAPAGWECIHLSTDFKKAAFPVAGLGLGRSLVRYKRLPVNSLGYIVSRAGAAKLLEARHRVRPFDLEFRLAWLSGLGDFRDLPCIGAREWASGDDHPGRLEGPRLHGNAHSVEAELGFAGAWVVLRDGAAEARRRLAFLDEVNSRSSASVFPRCLAGLGVCALAQWKTMMAMRYGQLTVRAGNIGDDLQSLAACQHLPVRSTVFVDRDMIHRDPNSAPGRPRSS